MIDNKKLLVKFEREFLHWLHGGAVWRGEYDPERGWSWKRWRTDETPNWQQELHDGVSFVIDDGYTPYRKAVVEGQTVQYNPSPCADCWADVENPEFNSYIDRYRIKPNVNGLSKDDWVALPNPGRVSSIEGEKAYVTYFTPELVSRVAIVKTAELVSWKPQEGELVIPNRHSTSDTFMVTKYRKYLGLDCEPYIGKLPEGFE